VTPLSGWADYDGRMSDLPPGGADFFGRIPLFREFARLLSGSGGPVNWELARQVAVATAAGAEVFGSTPALPATAPRTDPAQQRGWDDALRLAELWLEPVTTLPGPDVPVSAKLRSRVDWAEWVLTALPPLVEPAAKRMGAALSAGQDADFGPGAAGLGPMGLGPMMERIGGLMFGIQIGTVAGQLAHTISAHHELPIPVRDRGHVVILPENVTALEHSSGLPGDQVRLAIAAGQLVRLRVLEGVEWVSGHLTGMLEQVAGAIDPDTSGLADRLQSLDMARPESLQELLEGGDLLGESASPELKAALGRLEAFLALIDGYATTISRRVLDERLPALDAVMAELRRRADAPEGPGALFASIIQADPDRASGSRGERFCAAVLAATDVERLERVWAHADFLPSPAELDDPGSWLERMGLIGGEPVDLDEGLRRLLDEGGTGPA
jgi:putative hydrolase